MVFMKKSKKKYLLIVNADDFGLSRECTDAIVDSMNKGYLHSTSIMTNTEDFERACRLAREYNFIERIGLHLNLSEGYPLSEPIKNDPLFCDPTTGRFNRAFQKHIFMRILLPKKSQENLRTEIVTQIKKYLGGGLSPTFLDSHHHVHKELSVLMILLPIMKREGICRIRIAKNTGTSIKNFLNMIINIIIGLYPGINKKSEYLFQSIAEAEKSELKGKVEIEVHPYRLNGQLIDKTKDVSLLRNMSDIVKLKRNEG